MTGRGRDAGFTLVEVVAATAVLALLLGSIAVLAQSRVKLASLNERRTRAAGLLGLELERTHGASFDEVVSRTRTPSTLDPIFELEVRVRDAWTEDPPTPWTLLKEVEAEVYWPVTANRVSSLAGSTLVARREQP